MLWVIIDKSKAALGQIPYFDIYLLGNLEQINYLSDVQLSYFKVGSYNLFHMIFHRNENNNLVKVLGTECVLSIAASLK